MRTSDSRNIYLRAAERAFLCGGSGFGFGFGLFADGSELVYALDYHEDYKSHNDEVENVSQKRAYGHIQLPELDIQAANAACGVSGTEAVEYRLDDVVCERCDKTRKSRADKYADRKIEHIALEREFLEFLNEFFH